MAVVFPNIDIDQFKWRKAALDEKKLDSELEKYLDKPNMKRSTTPTKIRVEWPTILSSDCSTWLSTRKAESDKKKDDREKADDNPWLVKGGTMSAVDLANTVRVGLLRAGSVQAMETSPEKLETKEECRIPLPMTEEISVPKNAETEELVASQPISISEQVKMGLMRAGSISMQPSVAEDSLKKLWAPKEECRIPLPMTEEVSVTKNAETEELVASQPISISEQVKMGLMRAGSISIQPSVQEDSLKKLWAPKEECRIPHPKKEEVSVTKNAETEDLVASQPISFSAQVKMGLMRAGNISMQPSVQEDSAKKPWAPKSLAERVRMGLLSAGGELKIDASDPQVTVEEAAEPEVKIESTPDPVESLAETLKKSLLNIKVDQPSSPMKTSIADSLRESLLNISTSDAEEDKSESIDNWIMDDNQSEASIITLDTITDSLDMDDFDDFEDMEHELSMWIAKA
eukprot:GFUD01031508.1.p1 GENE.GFUD01031508.1~~GFUD01031508.1.p1  ORF type:complete len:459 (+),score=173.92 GFUD01031508.1:95-1471(+)